MQLRTNRFLILFATVLFLVEFLSPAFLTGTITTDSGPNHTHQLSTFKHPGFHLTLFSEQLNENEEERENYKNVSIPINFYKSFACSSAEYTLQTGSLLTNNLSQVFHSKPSLFRLHCVFQI